MLKFKEVTMLNWKTRRYGSVDAETMKGVIWFNIESADNGKFKISINGATTVNFKNRFDTVDDAKAACERWYVAQLKKELEALTSNQERKGE